MPFKFKIYYACSWWLLAWCLVVACFVIYGLASPSVQFTNGYITVPMVLLFLLVLVMESVFALCFIRHLKNASLFSNKEEKQSSLINNFTIFVAAILFIGMLLNVESLFRQHSYLKLFSDLSIIISTIAAIYLCTMYHVLKKAIAGKHYAIIESIGERLHD